MPTWKFCCEGKPEIPLPPEYTFPQAFNYLNSSNISFYILSRENGDYIQCGGDRHACTVELRIFDGPESYKHYVFGHAQGSENEAFVQMSEGVVYLLKREVLNRWDAIELFKCFFEERPFPEKYSLREKDI